MERKGSARSLSTSQLPTGSSASLDPSTLQHQSYQEEHQSLESPRSTSELHFDPSSTTQPQPYEQHQSLESPRSTSELQFDPSSTTQPQPYQEHQSLDPPRSTSELQFDPSSTTRHQSHEAQQLQSPASPRFATQLHLDPCTPQPHLDPSTSQPQELRSLESPRLNTKLRFLQALGAEEIKPNVYHLTKPYFQTLQSLEVNNPGLLGDIESEKFR